MRMKPLGTITMYFPFVDKGIASAIEEIMDNATNYYDFVLQLSERACQDETPEDLAYIAAAHSWRLSATPAKNLLLQRFNDDLWIRSWTSPHHKIGFERSFADIDQAIDEAKENWIRLELLCLKAWWARYQMADETYWEEPIGQAESLLRSHFNLECFGALVNTVRSEVSFMQSDYEKAYESHNHGMECAKKFNDKYQTYQLLWTRASWVKTWDAAKALQLQEAAYKLAKEFGSPQRTAEAMADMGRISEVLGEYNLALECYQSSLETFESPEMELYRELIDSPSFCMSRTYCELGDGMSGLEWIDSLIILLGPKADEHPYLYGQRAEALVLLDRLDEAAEQLDTCQKLSLKSGDEGYMSLYDLPMSYLEIAEGDPISAMGRLEPHYQSYTTAPAAIYINRFLIALARAEIAASLGDIEADASEQWLSKLGRHAREKQLPGIFMLHALLKADNLIARGLKSEAIETLCEVVLDEHSDTSSTLYQRIVNKIEDLELH